MTKILVVRIGAEPVVENVENPFNFAKQSLRGIDYVEVLHLPNNVAVYMSENFPRKLWFNRDIPAGELGFFRICGDLLLTKHWDGECVDLSDEEIQRYGDILALESNIGKCRRCGNPVAYEEAVFCGAACSAISEMS